jgi:hypothetical protein
MYVSAFSSIFPVLADDADVWATMITVSIWGVAGQNVSAPAGLPVSAACQGFSCAVWMAHTTRLVCRT